MELKAQEIGPEAEKRMKKAVEAFQKELLSLRSGRASAAIFDKLQVEYYGTPTPLTQLANISIPEARLVVIQPFDKGALSEIEKAILSSDLSLNPSNDGNLIRINIPPLTEESRKEIVKTAKSVAESAKVNVRNIRRDLNEQIKKSTEMSEDGQKRGSAEVQKSTDRYVEEISKILSAKEKEILEI